MGALELITSLPTDLQDLHEDMYVERTPATWPCRRTAALYSRHGLYLPGDEGSRLSKSQRQEDRQPRGYGFKLNV